MKRRSRRTNLDSETGHLQPQTVCEGLQASLGHAVGSHVQAGEKREDAGGENHPTCRSTGVNEESREEQQEHVEGGKMRSCGEWSTSAGSDQLQEGQRGSDGTKQVDVHHAGEILDGTPLDLRPL